MKNTFHEAILIILVAIFISLIVNGLRPKGIDLFANGEVGMDNQDPITVIDIDTAILKYNTQKVVFVDARSSEEFLLGHIKGAINLPDQYFDEWIEEIIYRIDPLTEIITYCDSVHCPQAKDLAEKLCSTGFENVVHFSEGYNQWLEYKMPVEGWTDG